MAVAFRTSELLDVAEQLRQAAAQAETNLADEMDGWADATADVMRDEIPVLSAETRDSVTVNRPGPLVATIGPTNRDDSGRPVGFFINYGTGRQGPDDFIGRTAAAARDAAANFDVGAVL